MILDPTVIPASDRSILVQFGDEISEDLHHQVFLFTQGLLASSHQAISNISPGYSSVLVRLHHKTTLAEGMDTIAAILKEEHPGDTILQRTVEIPVCYEDEFGPDLGRVLKHTGYDKEELIKRHASGRYLVYFLGFSAGFPYIGGMDASLATPRLETPRKAVPAGSVGIAGQQTGIYPLSTPGGWNLIGRPPLPLFKRSNPKDSAIRMGDRIRFRTVGRAEFEGLAQPQS